MKLDKQNSKNKCQIQLQKNRIKTTLAITILFTLFFIWGNSMLPASVSSKISTQIKEIIENILCLPQGAEEEVGRFITIRKLAHFLEFTFLGIQLTVYSFYHVRMPFSALLLSGVMTALIDETIQIFAIDRGPSVGDIWIDVAGFCFGIVCVICMRKFREKYKGMKEKETIEETIEETNKNL